MEVFLLLSQTESIRRLTFLHGKYVVIMLCSLEQIDHVHSIVIDMELEFYWFNLRALPFFEVEQQLKGKWRKLCPWSGKNRMART